MHLATTTADFDSFCPSYLERIQAVYEAGFRHIDLALYEVRENDELLVSNHWLENLEKIKAYAAEHGIRFVQAHAPGCNPFESEGAIERVVQLNKRALAICSQLGIPNMVLHAGWDDKLTKAEWYVRNRAFFSRLFPDMEKYGINILHENATQYAQTGKDLAEFIEYVNHPLFHACWDVGHGNLLGNQYHHIMELGPHLRGLHIHDNRGTGDEHVAPFLGITNMDEVMHALLDVGYKGYFTFECDSSLRPADSWQGKRRTFEKDQRLANPPLVLQKEMEKMNYAIGKYILSAYNIYEG